MSHAESTKIAVPIYQMEDESSPRLSDLLSQQVHCQSARDKGWSNTFSLTPDAMPEQQKVKRKEEVKQWRRKNPHLMVHP